MGKDKNAGIHVIVTENTPEGLDRAIKKLKRKIKKSNILVDLFDAQSYRKPSDIRREKKMKAKARNKYKVLEEQLGTIS